MYSKTIEIVFSLNVKHNKIKYVFDNIILDFPITYKNASVLCQLEYECLHKTINMVVFLIEYDENSCTELSLKRTEGSNPIDTGSHSPRDRFIK